MTQTRSSFVQTRRDAWVEINLGNIERNIKILRGYISSNVKFLAVVKADAYGHGAAMVAPTLLASGVDMLGVASVDEGIQLRESGINAPILVLGSAPSWAFVSAVEHNIQLSIFTHEHITACINTFNKLQKKPVVQIKVDTGMRRIGVLHSEAATLIRRVADIDCIKLEGIFTHLACAENPLVTKQQMEKWESVIKNLTDLELTVHAANTAGMLGYPDIHFDMVRSGIGIYGLMPDLPNQIAVKPDLKESMSLRGRIIHIQEVSDNSGISYGYSYITRNKKTKIATIPIGYADGVSRSLSNRIFGLINGNKIPQIGNITMDQMMFDISNIDNIETGDVITLLGNDNGSFISINSWAEELDTINYEISCRLKARLPRVYTRD